MKVKELKRCIRNSWCIEKHWDAIIAVIEAAEKLYYEKSIILDSNSQAGDKAITNLRQALQTLERITWDNEKSI
jgi:hypothetical protein